MKIFRWVVSFVFFITPQPIRHKIRDISSDSFVDFVQRHVSKKQIKKHTKKNKGRVLEEKLWGGFSSHALHDLLLLRDEESETKRNRAYAAWALARWYSCHLDHLEALKNVRLMKEFCTWKDFDLSQALLEADCLIQLQRYQEAEALVEHALTLRPKNPQLLLTLSNCFLYSNDQRRLDIINQIYQTSGFTTIEYHDDKKPLSIENIKSSDSIATAYNDGPSQPVVTVIMPVFSAAETLHIAIDSLLAQSWRKLEIIVVDDCSPDDTFSVAQRYAERDARVSAYQLDRNQGAYTARNFALSVATGDFVTTHDADDWSHPQKIETQVRHLLENNENYVANVTHWVRVYPNLEFRGTSRPTNHLIQWNHSSLMLRRELLLSLGGWDSVRITGDTELIWRLERLTGRRIARLCKKVPLSFALEDPSSLTRQGNSHVWTIHYGVRREYREMADYWHQYASEEELAFKDLSLSTKQRPFPAPGFILANKITARQFDVLMIMDCAQKNEGNIYNINILQSVLNRYGSVGVFHWPHYLSDVKAPIHNDIRDMAIQGKISIVVSGEVVDTERVIATNSLALCYQIDRPPKVTPEVFQVIVSESSLETMRVNDEFTSKQIEENINVIFNRDVEWLLSSDEGESIEKLFEGRQLKLYADL